MSCKNSNINNSGIGLFGLIILFYNFDDNNYDIYDLICRYMLKLIGE